MFLAVKVIIHVQQEPIFDKCCMIIFPFHRFSKDRLQNHLLSKFYQIGKMDVLFDDMVSD